MHKNTPTACERSDRSKLTIGWQNNNTQPDFTLEDKLIMYMQIKKNGTADEIEQALFEIKNRVKEKLGWMLSDIYLSNILRFRIAIYLIQEMLPGFGYR